MTESWYAELKTWQTAIGAVLGFLALMIGALWNFHLNRRRDTHLRLEESASVAAALYGEIVLLRSEVARIGNIVAARYMYCAVRRSEIFDKHFIEDLQIPESFIYKALAGKLGLLDSDLIITIAKFHQDLQEVRFWMPRLIKEETREYTYGILYVLHPARDAVINIGSALVKMEKLAKIQKSPQFQILKR